MAFPNYAQNWPTLACNPLVTYVRLPESVQTLYAELVTTRRAKACPPPFLVELDDRAADRCLPQPSTDNEASAWVTRRMREVSGIVVI